MEPTALKSTADKDSAALWRSVVSLALAIHLFCVGVVLASNFRRSPLLARLVTIFAAYTKVLHFDPDFTPYYYTLGRLTDDDAWIVIDLYASADLPVGRQEVAQRVRLPDGGSNWLAMWLEGRRRGIQLAKELAARGEAEGDDDQEVASEIARAAGRWAMQQTGTKRAVVRAMRRLSQPYALATLNPGFPPDRPTDPAYDTTVYEADAWIDEDGQVQLQRRASRAEVAPRQGAVSAPPAGNQNNATSPAP
jgi:hypothetical protein